MVDTKVHVLHHLQNVRNIPHMNEFINYPHAYRMALLTVVTPISLPVLSTESENYHTCKSVCRPRHSTAGTVCCWFSTIALFTVIGIFATDYSVDSCYWSTALVGKLLLL